jgi:ketosteroid isomerase-like protein
VARLRDTEAMSREDVDVVRAVWDAWERRDTDAMFELYDPEIVWDQTRDGPGDLAREYHGHDGVRQFFSEWMGSFESYQARALEFFDGDDAVLVRVRQTGRGKLSGIEVEIASGLQLYRVRDGRVVRIETHADADEAFRAAGLAR